VDRIAPEREYPRSTETVYRLHFANNGTTETNHSVILPVTLWIENQTFERPVFFIIAPQVNGGVLLGRSSLKELKIQVNFKPDESVDSEYLQEPVPVTVNMFSAGQELLVPETDDYLDGFSSQPTYEETSFEKIIMKRINEMNSQLKPEDDKEDVSTNYMKHYLNGFGELGNMEFADGYFIRLRPRNIGEKQDTRGQEHIFEVSWTLKEEPARAAWDSSQLIKNLSQNQKVEWDKHLDVFQNSQWWTKTQGKQGKMVSTVFPVQQKETKTTKVRPCCDMRVVNAASPKVSARMSTVMEAVLSLRNQVSPGIQIKQVDLNKAFYRIRTTIRGVDGNPYPILLKAGSNFFESDRLVFGLSCGPSGLNASQFIIQRIADAIWYATEKIEAPKRIIVMDDFLFIGTAEQTQRYFDLMEKTWHACGFDYKSHEWSQTEPQVWLGQQWTLSDEKVNMKRVRIDLELPTKWTKRIAFRCAGKFVQITGGYNEARAKVHADAIRQIAGKWDGWDQPCTDPQIIEDLRQHLKKALELWSECEEEDKNLCSFKKITDMEIRVDASQKGYGFIFLLESKILFAESKLFGNNTTSWHANRREFYALSQAVIKLDSLLHYFPSVRNVTLRSDSKVTVAHTDEFRNIASRSIERKVLLRIRNAILEIAYLWKTQNIKLRVMHIAGLDNTLADILSRESILEKHVSFIDVSERFTELTSLAEYKQWLKCREVFLCWKYKTPQGKNIGSIRTFLLAHQGRNAHEELKVRHFRDKIQVLVSEDLAECLLRHLHVQLGHARLGAVLSAFYEIAFCEKARKKAIKIINVCKECAVANPHRGNQNAYGPVYKPARPFEMIGIDLYGPLQRPSGSGNTKKHVLTVVCRLTGYTRFILLDDAKATSVVRAFELYLWEIGAPVRVLVTDNGPQFVLSPLLKGLCLLREIQHITLPLYAPFAGGFYEIRHRVATRCIRVLLAQFPIADWAVLIAVAQAKVNSHVGPDRSASPHQLIYGWRYSLPLQSAVENAIQGEIKEVDWNDPFTSPEQEAEERSKVRTEFLALWDEEFNKRQQEQERKFVPAEGEPLALGDYVIWKKDKLRRKFAQISDGPYRLVEQVGKHTWMIQNEDMLIPLKAHSRGLKKIHYEERKKDQGKRSVESMESSAGEEAQGVPPAIEEVTNEPSGEELGRGLRSRLSPEERFLASVHSTSSISGRLRRGSLIGKI